jgi:hypothetical protein
MALKRGENVMMGRAGAILATLLLAACQPAAPGAPPPGLATTLPLMGGYRDASDGCRRVGEDAYTNRFLDDAADLVACPAGMAGPSGLDSAAPLATKDGWALFSVPRR